MGRVVLAVDMPPNRSTVSIAACGARLDGVPHVELVDRRGGVGWVERRLSELLERQPVGSVVVEPAGPAGGLLVELEAVCGRAGVPLVKVAGREYAQACGQFYDAALAEAPQVRHIGQGVLDEALEAAVRQFTSDAWKWSRRSTDVDISPLVAVTLARYGWSVLPAPVDVEPIVLFG